MDKKERKSLFADNVDDEYIGNIFGWKISIAAAIVITAFIGLYFLSSHLNEGNQPIPTEHKTEQPVPPTNE